MAWEAQHDALLSAIEVLDLVPGKSGFPSSDTFRINALGKSKIRLCTASSTMAEVIVNGTGKWPYEEDFYVDRRQLAPFINVAREIKNKYGFVFTAGDGYMVVEHGGREVRLNPQPLITGFANAPLWKNPSQLIINKEFVTLMRCAATCATSEQKDPRLACVYLLPKNGLLAMANDTKSAIRIATQMNVGIEEPAPFPPEMLDVVTAPNLKQVKWTPRYLGVEFEGGVVWQALSRIAKDEFPLGLVNKVFSDREKEKIPEVCVVRASWMNKHIRYMSLYLQFVRKEDWRLHIEGTKGDDHITLLCRLPHSRFKETVVSSGPILRTFQLNWSLEKIIPIFEYLTRIKDSLVHIRLADDRHVAYLESGDLELMMSGKRI